MAKSYYTKTQNGGELLVELLSKNTLVANDQEFQVLPLKDGYYEVTSGSGKYRVLVVKRTPEYTRVLLNGRICDVAVESEGAQLIKKLGLDKVRSKKIKNITAPMPGMVLKVLAKPGQTVKKGEGLLVLEAMKMENLIKASGDATVGEIRIKEGQAVEKGQVLIKFN